MNPNKVAIITGSSRGIGAEAAKLFAENGYAVCINFISNVAAAENVKNEILQKGGRCISVKADVSISSEVVRLFETVDSELGAVSVLVNNAAILKSQSSLSEISEERFPEVLRVTVMSCFLCSKELEASGIVMQFEVKHDPMTNMLTCQDNLTDW